MAIDSFKNLAWCRDLITLRVLILVVLVIIVIPYYGSFILGNGPVLLECKTVLAVRFTRTI